jgi:hypothetical protein
MFEEARATLLSFHRRFKAERHTFLIHAGIFDSYKLQKLGCGFDHQELWSGRYCGSRSPLLDTDISRLRVWLCMQKSPKPEMVLVFSASL